MLTKHLSTMVAGIAIVTLGACGTTAPTTTPTASTYPAGSTYPASGTSTNVVAGYGVVQGIDLMPRESAARGIGVGTVAGAVVGGLIGHQIGSGRGNTAATIAGAAGGALAGRAIENNNAQQGGQVYRITLRMDNGTVQSLVQESQPSLRIGDRIRINNGVIERL